jgi:dihydroorotase
MEVETKECEFTYAAFGSIGLETSFAAAHTSLMKSVSLGQIVDQFCKGPREILGIEVPKIQKGQKAEITLFDPGVEWTYQGTQHSLSQNDALSGRTFTGKVIGSIYKGRVMIN